MSSLPDELKYCETHEWVRREEGGIYTVGITDYAQGTLGDMVFVELPEEGTTFSAGDECAVAESVKAASDIYIPISGEIVDVNSTLADKPELINSDPYSEGWLFKVRASDETQWNSLMGASDYKKLIDD